MSCFACIFAAQTPQYPAVLIASRLKWGLRLKFVENLKVDFMACSGSFQQKRLWTQGKLNRNYNWSKITGDESRYYWETPHSLSWLWIVAKSIPHWSFSTAWPAKLHSSSTTFQEGNKPRQPGKTKWNSKQDKGNPAIRAGVCFYFRHYLVRKITSRNIFHEKPKSHTIQTTCSTHWTEPLWGRRQALSLLSKTTAFFTHKATPYPIHQAQSRICSEPAVGWQFVPHTAPPTTGSLQLLPSCFQVSKLHSLGHRNGER